MKMGFLRHKAVKMNGKKNRSFVKQNYGLPHFRGSILFLRRLLPSRAFLRLN